MSFSLSPRASFILVVCLTICGCGTAEQPATTVKTAAPAAAKPQAKKLVEPRDKAKPVDKTSEQEAASPEEPQSAAYEPPYPDRENLFLAPRRSASNNTGPGNVEQSVELLGFANVSGPRVILSINGIVVPMSEGSTESGIEVISITPPAVVLQRNRERWQATLEN